MSEVVEEAIKGLEATDVLVDEIAEVVRVPNVKLLVGGTGVICLAGGAVLGYFVATRKLETKYSQLAEEEIEEMRDHFEKREMARTHEVKPSLDDLTAAYSPQPEEAEMPVDPVVDPQRAPMAVPPQVDTDDIPAATGKIVNNYTSLKETKNVFENQPDPSETGNGWDYATETKLRSAQSGAPYVIHRDELGEEDGWDCTSYTYFEGDDVLCDEVDRPLDGAERESMVNFSQTQLRFGDGSGEEDLVFVRNPHIQQEFEIRKSTGRYAKEVLGFDDEETGGESLSHSAIPRRRQPWRDA